MSTPQDKANDPDDTELFDDPRLPVSEGYDGEMNSTKKPSIQSPRQPAEEGVNLLAGICAVLFPGLGHIVSNRVQRGIYAMIGVLGLFGMGLLVGGIDAVDSKSGSDKFWFIGQACVGPLAFGVDYVHQNHFKAFDINTGQNRTGNPGEQRVNDGSRWIWEPAPTDTATQEGIPAGDANIPGLGRLNEIAMLSCTVAGMLNVIIILDAFLPTGYGRREEENIDGVTA